MTKLVKITLLSILMSYSSLLSAASNTDSGGTDNLIKQWLNLKRQVTIKERGGSLSLSGDVRSTFVTANEKRNGKKNIGHNSFHPTVADDQFDVAFSLVLDYRTDATWAAVKVKFDNDAGVFNGTTNKINLERAFWGIRAMNGDSYVLDLEIGRRKLGYVFDSKVEFSAQMDGILLKYDQSSESWGDFYAHGGAFVINERQDQIGYVLEAGVLSIANTGFYAKYSVIDWYTKEFRKDNFTSVSVDDATASRLARIGNHMFRFIVNQWLVGYKFTPCFNKVVTLYGAFLYNPAAGFNVIFEDEKANIAGYAGFSMGEARKKGDWALDWNLQYVEPQCVPSYDFSGIGSNNGDNIGLFAIGFDGTGQEATRNTAGSKANYIGWRFEFIYLLTDNLSISQCYQMSHSLHFLPTQYNYKQYRLDFIYAF